MKHAMTLILFALIAVLFAGCIAGCGGDGTSLLPQVTITHPDGTIEVRTDTEAITLLMDSVNGILDRVERYKALKAEAEAAGDKDEVDYLDRLITIGERELERRHVATPAPAAMTPTSPVGTTAP